MKKHIKIKLALDSQTIYRVPTSELKGIQGGYTVVAQTAACRGCA